MFCILEEDIFVYFCNMKILMCDNTLWGLVNFRGGVIRHFLDAGHQVVLVAPEKADAQMQIQVPEGVDYIPVYMGRTANNPFSDIRYFFKLWSIYRREKPDMVFHYTIKPNIYGSMAAKMCGISCCAMMAGLGFTFSSNSLTARIARWLYRVGLHFTDYLLVLNQENYDTILKSGLCKHHKVRLLPGGEGVDLHDFPFYDNRSPEVRLLFVGRILKEKGYFEYVEAARRIKPAYSHVRFELIGSLDPSYPNSVSRETVEKDQDAGLITYLGFTNDMQDIYRCPGTVMVLPSYYSEGMNRSLMEACATGKPIITTDIAGCRELVDEGVNGYVVPIRDSEALATAIERYLSLTNEEKDRFSHASRRKAEETFDQTSVLQIYDQILLKQL
jgi:glycosyltransferase involved in cell wall biosynthesis